MTILRYQLQEPFIIKQYAFQNMHPDMDIIMVIFYL